MKLYEIVSFLDSYLNISEWENIDSSKNGLQVESCNSIEKVAFSVDACMDSFKKAVETKANLLITHHGLFWKDFKGITGIMAKRLKYLIKNELSLYAAHLPLDAHPEVGNNIQIAKILEMDIEGAFAQYHGKTIGFYGKIEDSINNIAKKLEEKLKTKPLVLEFSKNISKAGVVSGRGGFSIYDAEKLDIDLLITGEAEHSIYHTAKELGISLIFAGHYATEVVGLKALMKKVRELGLETVFIDCPTGI